MYRIAIVSDHLDTGQKIADQVTRFCHEKGVFPKIDLHSDPESFFGGILDAKPTNVILSLPGVAGLNAAEHLHSLLPHCGLIWCSDLDFSVHAFKLRADYFILSPVDEERLREGLTVWTENANRRNFVSRHRNAPEMKNAALST